MGNRNTQDCCLQPAPFEGAIQVANRVILYRYALLLLRGQLFGGGGVRLSHPPTRGDACQTLAELVVLELVPVGGS